MTGKNLSLVPALAALVFSCSQKPAQVAPPPPELQVVEVSTQRIPLEREFVGQVYGIADIPIRARVEGFLESLHFNEGRKVRKGQLLYRIDPQPFEAKVAAEKSRLAEARIKAVNADNELNRYEPLAKANAVSQSDLDAALAQKGAADAAVEAAEAALRLAEIELGYTRIKAPISGIIGKTQAKVGEFVGRSPNPVILNTVSQLDSVLVEFFVTESEYLEFARERIEIARTGRSPRGNRSLGLRLILADGSEFPYPGYVKFVDREIDPSTGSLLVQSVFPNPDKLIRPGQFAKVIAIADLLEAGLIIPQRSVLELQGRYQTYVVNDSNKLELRQLQLGPTWKDYWIVEDGVAAGEQVLLEGLQMARGGMPVVPVPVEFESKASQAN